MVVYDDIFSYSSGTYELTAPDGGTGHAVKLVGWGNDGTNDYWIAQNSWGPNWGMNGYFNIKMGEVGIDYQAIGCVPEW